MIRLLLTLALLAAHTRTGVPRTDATPTVREIECRYLAGHAERVRDDLEAWYAEAPPAVLDSLARDFAGDCPWEG